MTWEIHEDNGVGVKVEQAFSQEFQSFVEPQTCPAGGEGRHKDVDNGGDGFTRDCHNGCRAGRCLGKCGRVEAPQTPPLLLAKLAPHAVVHGFSQLATSWVMFDVGDIKENSFASFVL